MNWAHAVGLEALAGFAKGHVSSISYAMATSLVVAVSAPINLLVAKLVGRFNFVLRTLVFILLFTAGYALLAYWSENILRQFLSDQKPYPLLVLTVLAFSGFGLWASRQRNLRS